MAVVRILGVDPGTVVVGFGCLELHEGAARSTVESSLLAHRAVNALRGPSAGHRVGLIEHGVLRLGGRNVPVARRLCNLAERLGELLDRLEPAEVALEEAFYGKSVQSALRIGEARGVVLAEATRRRVDVHQFAPARIKRCVAGHGSASKEAVARMTGELLALGQAPTPTDASDALAVALCRVEDRQHRL